MHNFHSDTFEDGSNTNKFPLKQPYRCLDSIAHYLKGILSLEEASDMLEIYFNEESNSPFKSTSPYMLAHVLHPSTISKPTSTRTISPALVSVILFCVAQTADMKIFDTPGARERTSVDLYRLSLNLLQSEDPDNYFRTSGKSISEQDASVAYLMLIPLSRWVAIPSSDHEQPPA